MKNEITQKVINFSGKIVEVIKDELFVDSIVLSESQSALARSEYNDCFVRATMVALNISYEKAHEFIAQKFARKFGQGTSVASYARNFINTVKNGKKIKFMGLAPVVPKNVATQMGVTYKMLANPKYKKPTSFTVKSFMESHPTGSYILILDRHAVAVVNGVFYGNTNEKYSQLYRTVFYGFEMK